jgi:predicted nucleic acid-binding protein
MPNANRGETEVRIYLDTAPVIYTVERVPLLAEAVDRKISAAGVVLVASDLTRMECRVKPMQAGDLALLKDFDDYFAGVVSEIVTLSAAVLDRATEIRALYNFKTPDAIHLAAAVISGCDLFLTNDLRLARYSGIPVEDVRP